MKLCGFFKRLKVKVEPTSSIEDSVVYSDLGESLSIATDSEAFDEDSIAFNRVEEADERILSMLPSSLSLSSKNSLESIKNFEASFKEYLSPNRTMTNECKVESARSDPNAEELSADRSSEDGKSDTTSTKKHLSGTNLINYELIIKPRYNTDTKESTFKCVLRKVGSNSDSSGSCELAVDEVVNRNIHALVDSLGLSDDAMKIGKSRLTGHIHGKPIQGPCTSLVSLLSCNKSQKKTSLRHYLEENEAFKAVHRDLSALSTISDIAADNDEFNIFNQIATLVDKAINGITDDSAQTGSYVFGTSNHKKTRSRFGDMSDIPLLF